MQMILTPAFIRRSALARSSPNSRSSSAISLPGTECRENLLVFGEIDVTSHRARLNSIDTNIAAPSTELDNLGSRLRLRFSPTPAGPLVAILMVSYGCPCLVAQSDLQIGKRGECGLKSCGRAGAMGQLV